ncbi:MAG: rod shape-determining protein MreC [Aggregatilineales bacterium]
MNQTFRRGWRSNRTVFFVICMLLCAGLIAASSAGLLSPVESVIATPLNAVSGFFNRAALVMTNAVADLAEFRSLQQRNAELETALARFQSELVELREIASDYRRLANLLNYTTTTIGQEFVTAEVIAVQQDVLRTITINRGARDGIRIGMPVVTELGLVGRIIGVQANASRVLLITDPGSAVSARLQTTRAEGTVRGQISGNLEMTFIPLGEQIQNGDLVITSGLGGNLPPDLLIGQVTSSRAGESVYQTAQIRSLINFDTLEFVLVITNFQPIDLSAFDNSN